MRSPLLHWVLRVVPFVLVIVFSIVAFQSGVDLSERPGLPQADWHTQLYYATGLFVLGGLDLGTPVGGPGWLREGLWICYFVAPLATTTVLAEGLIRLIRPRWWTRLRRRDHVIVVGLGRYGILMVEALREVSPKRRIVAVERDPHRASVEEARQRLGVEVIIGDITYRSTCEELCLERAASLALMTHEDLVNLEAAWDLTADRPDLPTLVQVTDIATYRKVDKLTSGRAFHFFNAHRFAAQYLFDHVLRDRFASTRERDVVVLGGFGRFGQTILERLQKEGGPAVRKVVLVDKDAEQRAEIFSDQVGFHEDIEWESMGADLADPRTWAAIESSLVGHEGELSFVLGTDDDALNLRLAMSLRERHPQATVALRCFHRSRFNQELAESLELTLLSMEDLVRSAVVDHLLDHLGMGRD